MQKNREHVNKGVDTTTCCGMVMVNEAETKTGSSRYPADGC
jgi:hypothetical protein